MSTLMIPFNHQPVEIAHLDGAAGTTSTYTIPSGKYARVSYWIKYGSYFTVNGNYIADAMSSSGYAEPNALDNIQIGWEGFNDTLDCGASVGSPNSTTYNFDSGYIYSNVRLSIELNDTYNATYLRANYGTDSNNILPVFKERAGYTNATTKDYVVDTSAVLDNITGSIELRLITNATYTQTATLRIYGSRKREHDGQSFNSNGVIWCKSGDVLLLGETHFLNSTGYCHIELYNEQS